MFSNLSSRTWQGDRGPFIPPVKYGADEVPAGTFHGGDEVPAGTFH